MNASQLLMELSRQGLRLEANGDQLRIAPWSAVTSALKEQVKTRKAELLKILNAGPPTASERIEAYQAMTERINKAYQGNPIDWQYLERLTAQIMQATSQAELMQAVAEYENVALCQNSLDFINNNRKDGQPANER